MLIGIDASRALRAKRTGTERYSLEIIRHLLAQPAAGEHTWRLYIDQAVDVGCFWLDGKREMPAIDLSLLPARQMWTHRALAGEVVRHPPDVLFVPAHVLPFVLPVWRLPASVVTVHDLGYRYFPAAHPWRQRWYLEWSTAWNTLAATHLIAVSQSTANDLHRFYATPLRRITVVHEARPEENDNSPAQRDEVIARYGLAQPYLLFVGTIQPRKNLARLLQAYGQFIAGGQYAYDLVLAGGQGWRPEPLSGLIQELGLAGRVHLLGYVPDADLPALYQAAIAFCFPSLFEGFGLPLLEAQTYGVPVMTANNSALPEIAGGAALLVDPTDVDAIADAMLRLTQDEALRQRLISAGHENVKRFSWAKAARETLDVLLAAAGKKQRAGDQKTAATKG